MGILCITIPTVIYTLPQNSDSSCSSQQCKDCLGSCSGCDQCNLCGLCLGVKVVPVLNASTVITEQKDARNCVIVARRNLPVRSVLINVHKYSLSNCFNKLLNIKK